jgi:hypothetical protein
MTQVFGYIFMGKHLFRSHEQIREIFEVYQACGGVNETARQTGIPHTTVQRYLAKYKSLAHFDAEHLEILSPVLPLKTPLEEFPELKAAYAYVLGIYLGDGHITDTRRENSKRMMIYLDKNYPQIIQRCIEMLETILPDNSAKAVDRGTWVYVSCVSRYWPELIPQHAKGKKHERSIILEEWQKQIIDAYPLEFFRGLYHSDGSRSRNVVRGKDYSRYFFCNKSEDIRKLFTAAVEKIGLKWTQTNELNIAISRRDDVAWLDEHVGAKL